MLLDEIIRRYRNLYFFHSLAKFVDYRLEDEDRSGGSEDGERLTGEEAVTDTADETGNQRLHCGHVLASGFAQESAECDYRRETGEVQEYEGGYALECEGVFEVGQIEGSFSFDIVDETPEQPTGSRETRFLAKLLLVGLLVHFFLGLFLLRPFSRVLNFFFF